MRISDWSSDVCSSDLAADLTRESEVAALVPAAEEALGPVTLLVNNASPFVEDGIADPRRDSWDLHMETNLRAPVVLIRDLARRLPEGETGNVVNMLDQRVLNLTPNFLSYTLSKSGLWTLTRTLALALARSEEHTSELHSILRI